MFGSNALSLPATFAHEHRPLRLTSEHGRPQPTGECRYARQPGAPSHQPCPCQAFHHDRSSLGNVCDCGHQACYHVHAATNDKASPSHPPYATTTHPHHVSSEYDKRIKRLEETIQSERENRKNALQREREMWEREVRILREALASFYQTERTLRRKMADLEERLHNGGSHALRPRERLTADDGGNTSVEKDVHERDGVRSKRRRVGRPPEGEEVAQNGHEFSDPSCRFGTTLDDSFAFTPFSTESSPSGLVPPGPTGDEPRSSGILDLVVVDAPRSATLHASPTLAASRVEPRPGGMLHREGADRLGQKAASDPGRTARDVFPASPAFHRPSPPRFSHSATDRSRPSQSPPDRTPDSVPRSGVVPATIDDAPRKRKHTNHGALDLLAEVSATTQLIQ